MDGLLFEFAIRITLIAAMTGAVLWAMRIQNAAAKHSAWAAVIAVMLLLPTWIVWGPKATIPILPTQPATIAAIELAPVSLNDLSEPMPIPDRALPSVQSRVPKLNWKEVLLGIYLLGVIILLLRLAIGTIRAGWLTSASCAAPVTVGLLRPRIILPDAASEWSPAQLDAVLAHEREHVRRRDPLFQWLALLNRAVFWFHPLAWWLERRLAALAEEACDAAVLEQGLDPREYSMCLLEMARAVDRAGSRVNAVAMAMPGSYLPQRVKKIIGGALAPRVSRTRLAAAAIACAIPAALFAGGSLDRAPQLLLMAPFPMKSVPQPPVLLAQAAEPSKNTPPKPEAGAPSQDDLKFEVASVRALPPIPSGASIAYSIMGGPGTDDPQRIRYVQAPLNQVLARAYQLQLDQIAGPQWVKEPTVADRFEIIANVPPGTSVPQVNVMLQNLLKERFRLAYHIEKRSLDAYELAVAKGGSKLPNAVIPQEMPTRETGKPAQTFKGDDGYPNLPPGWPEGVGLVENSRMEFFFPVKANAGFTPYPPTGVFSAGGRLQIWHLAMRMVTLPQFVDMLSRSAGMAHVVDHTGLTGTYDIKLRFSNGGTDADGQPSEPAPDFNAALEEQLGLKLQKVKTPLDVLVIDHIDRTPVEN